MAYTTIDKPSDYFDTVTYQGSGGNNFAISSLDFAPNLTWIKRMTSTQNHFLFDTVRGNNKYVNSNTTDQEYTEANSFTFDSNGFTFPTYWDALSDSSGTTAAWNWKAGTSFTNDASATGIGNIDSTGSVNTDAGFSIISYTGTGSAGTVAHGLGAVPKMIIIKSRNTTSLWGVYHQAIGNTHGLFLNATNAATSLSAYWNNTSPTSSVFSLGGDADINKSSDPLIAYCFAEKQGYSKFGSYTGNGNANGTFIYTGFKPAMIIFKQTNTAGGHWYIYDNKRGQNELDEHLYPNLSSAEATGDNAIDILSNSFKMRSSNGDSNASGSTYIYMAFAENPFVSSTGVPATAR